MKKKGGFKTKLIKGIGGVLLVSTIIMSHSGCANDVEKTVPIESAELDNFSQQNLNFGILVNKDNKFTQEQIDQVDLVETTDVNGYVVYLQKDTLEAFNAMKAELEKQGYMIGINAGFRSYEDQEAIYKELEQQQGKDYADQYAAAVGYSEHHTGLAVDVYMGRNRILGKDVPLQVNPKYQKTKEKMYEIMADYGFILRYPEGKEEITGYPEEAWHIRYVGPELAKLLAKKNLTLEEFHEALNQYNNLTENEEEFAN